MYNCFTCMFRGSLNHMVRLEKEKENHRNTPPRYQKHHINGNLNLIYLLIIVLFGQKNENE